MSSRNGKVKSWAEVYQKFEQRCSIKRVKPSSMFTYGRTMGRFCEWADAEGIAPADIEIFDVEDYLGGLRQDNGAPYAAHSLRTYCKDTRTLLNFAHDRKIFADRIKVELPKTPDDDIKALTDEELEKVLAYFKDQPNPRDAAIVHLLKDTGIRAAELIALNWADISWDHEKQLGTVQITKQMNRKREMVSPKSGKPRTAFFYAETWAWLATMQIEEGISWTVGESDSVNEPGWDGFGFDPANPVFWLSYGDPERMGAPGLGKMLREAGKQLGIRLYPHLFRHTCGRLMTKAGVSPIAIAQILGHSGLTMVMRYSRLWGLDLAEVMAEAMNGYGHK
jgi:integrase